MIRDRIDYTVQNLLIAKYEHIFAHILKYKSFCLRDDVFTMIVMIHDAETEEQYLEKLKRLIAYVKLVLPELLEMYHTDNMIESARGTMGSAYYLAIPLRELYDKQSRIDKALEDYF